LVFDVTFLFPEDLDAHIYFCLGKIDFYASLSFCDEQIQAADFVAESLIALLYSLELNKFESFPESLFSFLVIYLVHKNFCFEIPSQLNAFV